MQDISFNKAILGECKRMRLTFWYINQRSAWQDVVWVYILGLGTILRQKRLLLFW